jgi:hypothetical protein
LLILVKNQETISDFFALPFPDNIPRHVQRAFAKNISITFSLADASKRAGFKSPQGFRRML